MSEGNIKATKIFRFVWTLTLILVSLSAGYLLGTSSILYKNSKNGILNNNLLYEYDNTPRTSMDLYWEVWNTLRDEYVDRGKYNDEEMIYGSIKGLVNSYEDPATVFLDPKETADFNDQSAGKLYEGIGAELAKRDGLIKVVTPIKGSPAEAAGLKVGDIIIKLDQEEIKVSDTVYDVVAKIRGEAGTDIVLTVLRQGENEMIDIKITRGKIVVPSVTVKKPSDYSDEFSSYDENTAVISVSRFTDDTPGIWNSEWDKAVNQVIKSDKKNIIIDLRNNPGGFFNAAIYSLEEFFDNGVLLAKQSDRDGKETLFISERAGKLRDKNIVVLVNEGSASASEIFAGAIKHYGRGKIIGTKTYGKGTAQIVIPFSDKSSLHITTAKWLLPSGQWINPDDPVNPDVEIDYEAEESDEEIDLFMKEAVNNLSN